MSEGEEKRKTKSTRNKKGKKKKKKKEDERKKERIPSEQRRVSDPPKVVDAQSCAVSDVPYKSMCINCLCPSQSGFLSGDSTTNQLLCIYEYLCSNFDKRIITQSVYFDMIFPRLLIVNGT